MQISYIRAFLQAVLPLLMPPIHSSQPCSSCYLSQISTTFFPQLCPVEDVNRKYNPVQIYHYKCIFLFVLSFKTNAKQVIIGWVTQAERKQDSCRDSNIQTCIYHSQFLTATESPIQSVWIPQSIKAFTGAFSLGICVYLCSARIENWF